MKVTAKATRSGDWWAIEVPEVPGVFTQAKRLDQVEEMVRDAVALMQDVPEAEVEVVLDPLLGNDADVDVRAVVHDRVFVEELQEALSAKVREVADTLVKVQGLSLRDAGKLLGVSHQRVAQLLGVPPPVSKSTKTTVRTTRRVRGKTTTVTKSVGSGQFVQKGAGAARKSTNSPKRIAAKASRSTKP